MRIRNKFADSWIGKPIDFIAALGSNQHTTRQAYDGTRFYRWFPGGSTYNVNGIVDTANGTVQLVGYDNTPTIGSEANGAAVLEWKKGALGFFGTTPVAKQSVSAAATDAASAQTLVNSLRSALVAYGLVA